MWGFPHFLRTMPPDLERLSRDNVKIDTDPASQQFFNLSTILTLVVSLKGVNLSQGVQDEMPQILVVKVSFRMSSRRTNISLQKTVAQTCLCLSKWSLVGSR